LAGALRWRRRAQSLQLAASSIILWLGLGYFKLGRIVRFLPYPIIGGFLAGSGWLLVQGGIGIMANTDPGFKWFQADILALWVPGVVLGVIIYTVR
jgi:SulP family sulfate permease